MPTHLYCLLRAEADSTPPTGADGVRALVVGGIVAWVGDASAERLPRDRKGASLAAIDHDRVIGLGLARGLTPVPATLADPYPSDTAAVTDIAGRADEILAGLVRVAGMVEMTVIITGGTEASGPEAPAGDARPGRAYLERLRDLPARLSAAADVVEARLGAIAEASNRRVEPSRVAISHLVRREDVVRYRTTVLQDASDSYRLLIDGPRAPYSFSPFSPQPGRGPDSA